MAQNGLFWAIFGPPLGGPFQLTLSWSADLGHLEAKSGQKGVPNMAQNGPFGPPQEGLLGGPLAESSHFEPYLGPLNGPWDRSQALAWGPVFEPFPSKSSRLSEQSWIQPLGRGPGQGASLIMNPRYDT
jgi:hypothetical protein